MWRNRWAKAVSVQFDETTIGPIFLRKGKSIEEAEQEARRHEGIAFNPPIPFFGYAGGPRYPVTPNPEDPPDR